MSLRSLLIDINIMPMIVCHLNCVIATIISEAIASVHADIMFVLKGLARLNEMQATNKLIIQTNALKDDTHTWCKKEQMVK